MLGITVTSHLPTSEHVHDVICNSAQSLHALKLLHYHNVSDDLLRHTYKPVDLSKLLCVSPA